MGREGERERETTGGAFITRPGFQTPSSRRGQFISCINNPQRDSMTSVAINSTGVASSGLSGTRPKWRHQQEGRELDNGSEPDERRTNEL